MSSTPAPRPQLLLLEAHSGLGASMAPQLASMGYHLRWTGDLQTFLKMQAEVRPQVQLVELERGDIGPSPQDLTALLQTREAGSPLVLISAQNDLVARLQVVRTGCDIYLPYPVDLEALASRLDALLEPPPREPERVLVVEDSPVQANYVGSILREAGMEVCLVTNPSETLELLADFKPDLILTDLYMPQCTGIELADDFLTKPIQPNHLVSSVRIRAERTRLLRSLMSRDSLTGLRNHSTMKSRLEEEWIRSQRIQTPFSFAMVDLDHFKQVNDT